MTASDRGVERNEPDLFVAPEVPELLGHGAEALQFPLEAGPRPELALVESSRRFDCRVPGRVVAGVDHGRENLADRPLDDLGPGDQRHRSGLSADGLSPGRMGFRPFVVGWDVLADDV